MSKHGELTLKGADRASSLNKAAVLVSILLCYIFLWLIYPKLFHASDPWAYSRHAYNASIGAFLEPVADPIFGHRLGVTLPTAAFYKLFGVNNLSTNLWNLLMSCAAIGLVWIAAPQGNAKFFASLLLATSVVQFQQSAILMPDLIVSTSMLAASVLLAKRRTLIQNPALTSIGAFGAALMLFLAFLTKLTVYWVLIFWIIVFCYDMARRQWGVVRRFYLPVMLWGGLFGIIYLLLTDYLWGSPLARLDAVQGLTGQHLWAWDGATILDLLKRLTYEPALVLLKRFSPVILLAVGGLAVANPKNKFWVGQGVLYLLLWWFGSSSLSSYEPLPLSFPRMILPALPAMSILGGSFLALLSNLLQQSPAQTVGLHFAPLIRHIAGWFGRSEMCHGHQYGKYVILAQLALVGLSGLGNLSLKKSLILAGIVMGMAILLKLSRPTFRLSRYHVFVGLVVVLVCTPLLNSIRNERTASASRLAEMRAMAEVTTILSEVEGTILLLCLDSRSPESLTYYWGYEYPSRLTVRYYGAVGLAEDLDADRILIFNNGKRSRFLAESYGEPHLTADILTRLPGRHIFNQAEVQLFEVATEPLRVQN